MDRTLYTTTNVIVLLRMVSQAWKRSPWWWLFSLNPSGAPPQYTPIIYSTDESFTINDYKKSHWPLFRGSFKEQRIKNCKQKGFQTQKEHVCWNPRRQGQKKCLEELVYPLQEIPSITHASLNFSRQNGRNVHVRITGKG